MNASVLRSMILVMVPGLFVIAGCGSTHQSAPVVDRAPPPSDGSPVETRTVDTRPPVGTSQQVATRTTAAKPAPDTAESTSTTAPPASPKTAVSDQSGGVRTVSRAEAKPYREGDWRPEYYTVLKGDTLYSIALDFGREYRELADWNNLADAAYIQVGQRIRLFPPGGVTVASESEPPELAPATLPGFENKRATSIGVPTFSDPRAYRSEYSEQAFAQLRRVLAGEVETTVLATETVQAKPAPPKQTSPKPAKPAQTAVSTPGDERLKWEWPAPGKLLYGFSKGPIKKGIAIEGQPGQSVVSSAPGKVVYSGSGLRGYGNLIIVKHNETYLSVYALNKQLLVSEGQMVAQGQKIAVMGEIPGGHTALHFEIRRLGKPIDPLEYLPDRAS